MGIGFRVARPLLKPVGMALRGSRAGTAHDVPTTLGLADEQAVRNLWVTSTSFRADGVIPLRFCGRPMGDNVSPQLSWTSPPAETVQLLIVIEDTDVPRPRPSLHLGAALDPGIHTLSEGELNAAKAPPGVRLLGGTRLKGYSGPTPLPGHGSHRYDHHVLALAVALPGDVVTIGDAIAQAKGNVLAHGVLTGTQRN